MLIWKSKEISTFMVSFKKTVLAYRYTDRMVKKMWLNVEISVKDIRKLFVLFLQLLYKSVIISLKKLKTKWQFCLEQNTLYLHLNTILKNYFYEHLTLEKVAGVKRLLYIQDQKVYNKSPLQLRDAWNLPEHNGYLL